MDSLWNDFERRTVDYDYVRNTLGRTNLRLLHWIGSIDRCGYTREECLRKLIATFQPGDENRILLRLSDWVPQVQAPARDWILENFQKLPLEAIFSNQHLILYLARKERLREDPAIEEIIRDLLGRMASIERVHFFEFDPKFRRFLFSQSLRREAFLRSWILDDPDPFNRWLLLDHVGFAALTETEQTRLGSDRSVFVRRRYFRSLIETGTQPTQEELVTLAMDFNRSLRELGQYYLAKIYQVDACSLYKEQKGERFYFIADYARKEDVEHFLRGVRTGTKSTKQLCLCALAACSKDRLVELDIASLIGENRRLRSTITPHLPHILSIDQILALRKIFEESSPSGAISFLRVLEKKSFWAFVETGLDYLLESPTDALHHFFFTSIQGKTAVYEPLPAARRESIFRKIQKLQLDPNNRNEAVVRFLEFSIGKA